MSQQRFDDDTLAHAHAHAVVGELVGAGVEHVALSPGTTGAPLVVALALDGRIQVHVVLDERSAAFLALGIARASGRPAAVLSTSGTAPANFLPAILEARQSALPLLVVTADRPPDLREVGATPSVDQVKMFGDAVVRFFDMAVPSPHASSVPAWRATTCRAVADAVGPPAGPVHLNVCFRGGVTPRLWAPPPMRQPRPGGQVAWTHVTPALPALPESELLRLAVAVESAERGVVVVGGVSELDPGPVLAFARAVGWPVFAEPTSGVRCGRESIGAYEALLRSSFAAAHPPDLVLRIGATGLTPATSAYAGAAPHVLIDGSGQWPDPSRAATWLLRADPGRLLTQLLEVTKPRQPWWLEQWEHADDDAQRAIDAVLDGERTLTEPHVARALAAAVPDGSILFVGPSMPMRDCDWFMRPRSNVRVLGNRGVNGIDGFVSSAIGAAVGTAAPVFALAGDLTLAHDQNGLLAAAGANAEVVFVVVNNNGGGIFSFLPDAPAMAEFERLFVAGQDIDFARLAALYGCSHDVVSTVEELHGVIGDRRPGVRIVEVPSDRDRNVALHGRLWAAVEDAVGPSTEERLPAVAIRDGNGNGATPDVSHLIDIETTIERRVPQETMRGTR